MNGDIKFCDGCKWLHPTEEEQDKDKPIHRCLKTGHRLIHGSHHPKIMRPSTCSSYEEINYG